MQIVRQSICDPVTSLFYYTQVLARPSGDAGEAEDWVTVALGSAYDEPSGLYYHVILLLENELE